MTRGWVGRAATTGGAGKVRATLAVPRAVVGFLGLTAVIVGILAMHVWMGGHGATAARGSHALTSPASAVSAASPAAAVSAHHAGNDHATVDPMKSVVQELSHAPELSHGSAGPCHSDDGAAMGLCVVAFIVVTFFAFLLAAGRLVPGSVLLRGPPLIRLQALSIPALSLIRLCISRT